MWDSISSMTHGSGPLAAVALVAVIVVIVALDAWGRGGKLLRKIVAWVRKVNEDEPHYRVGILLAGEDGAHVASVIRDELDHVTFYPIKGVVRFNNKLSLQVVGAVTWKDNECTLTLQYYDSVGQPQTKAVLQIAVRNSRELSARQELGHLAANAIAAVLQR